MSEAEANIGTQQIQGASESLFGTLDIVLLALIVGGISWYLLNKHKKTKTIANGRSYSIQPTSINLQTSTDNSFIKKLQSSGRSLVVFYGSQTGTGEEFAGRLAKEGVRYRMKGMVADPEECDMEELVNLKNLPNSLAVFCLATYGEGDPTDNAMEFYEWLQNGDADLTGLNYAVFGLGNRTALMHYVDITQNPRTHVLKELAEYCTDPAEKEKLKSMSTTTPEGKALYQKWIIEDNRNIVHILEDMSSCHPALDHLCELLPRLQPRYYSISSSPKLYPNTVHITAVLVEYDTPTGRHNKGVATTWLKTKMPDPEKELPTVPIFVRKSQFRLPTKPQTPIIMIGPGTGFAPFRGFIQDRNLCKEEGKPVGDTVLYFGCRKSSEDYIYEEELVEYHKSGLLTLHLAFSRDQAKKVYVTHLLEQQADEVWKIIGENNGHIYICGDAKSMATDVRAILIKILQEKGSLTEEQATAYLKKMETQKRLSADVWS
ncbi:unnamed protein product [Diabrotica balteata]|uniref:NADPH--hemoprotein reductase n=1 Tax=Diabrotica balteata TaxID=107213 RepID=A0A9N9X9S8_DIABA|nr:unnamed protein product [Diabrotica balteata]